MGSRIRKARRKLVSVSEQRHGTFHLLFGLIAFLTGYFTQKEFFENHNILILFAVLIGSFIPDLDHLLYQFGYGRKKEYAADCRKFIKNMDFRGYLNYVKANHKHNTNIYSHNIGSLVIAFLLSMYALHTFNNIYYSMFFLAWTFHYIYDILEDILFFKKPNKNWFFVFGKN